jgi:ribosomal protein S18 acetylase RimI-like enzyme
MAVVERNNRIEGYIQHGSPTPQMHEIYAFYVDPVRGLGAGWARWNHVLAHARSRGQSRIELWVFEKNQIGRGWYQRQGGVVVGSSELHLQDGDETEQRYRFILNS